MATILGLAMKISADATGVQKSLTPVERALQKLDEQAKTVTTAFDRFAGSSSAAAAAQAKAAADLERLTQQLQTGAITAPEFAARFEELGNAVDAEVAAFERAARTIEANRTPLERYDAEVKVLSQDLEAGRIDQETFDRAVSKATATFTKAELAAQGYGNAIEVAGKGNLQFNELSGILSALPGPLGNVAGRISGISSASEGLARVFSGGLSAGISSVGTSIAGLVNPFTVGIAAIAGFGTAASAVVGGLGQLTGKVEELGFAARQAGVDFGTIQILEEAATRANVPVEALATGIQKFSARLADATKGSGDTFTALEQLGFTLQDIQAAQNDPTAFAGRVAKALDQIPEPAKRAQLQIDILGKGGEALVRAFGEIDGSAQAVRRFGGAISELDANRLLELDGAFENVQRSILGLGRELLTPFIGITQSIADGLAPAIATFGRNIGAVLDTFSPLTSAIGLLVNGFLQIASTIGNVIGTAFEPFATAGRTVAGVFDSLSKATTALFGRINDVVLGFREFFQFEGVAAAFRDTFAQIGDVISRVSTIVTTAFSKIGEVLGNTLGEAISYVSDTVSAFTEFVGLSGALENIGGLISRVFGSVSSVFSTIASAIGGTVGRLLTMAENFLGIERSTEGAAKGVDQITQSTQQLTEEQKKGYEEVQKAVAGSGKALDDAIMKAGEFGQAGFNAALEFQNALADLKEQADNNELNAEQYSRGVALATAEFDKQVESLKQVQEETRKAAEEAQRRVDADLQVSDALLEQARIAREFGGDNARAKAAEDALAVEREIARVRQEVSAARDNGDEQAVMNGETRIAQLEKIRGEQQAIADGSAKAAADEAQRLADQEERVNKLLNAGREQTQLEQQIADVQQVQARTAQELAAARLANNEQAANAAAAKLAQLDQLQASLSDQQQATAQGFGEGFAKAFEQIDQTIQQSATKAAEFGDAGFRAYQRLQEGVSVLQQQARDGILNKEALGQEVAKLQALFQQQLQGAANVNNLLFQQLSGQDQQRAIFAQQEEERRIQATKNIAAIEEEIAATKEAVEKAREDGDLKAAKAAVQRLQQLGQILNGEKQIAAGRQQQQQGFTQDQVAQREQFAKAQDEQYKQALQQQQQLLAARAQAEQAEYERQAARITELNTLGSRTVQTADIRTQEGQNLVLGLAANAQDPALIEARLQTKQLQLISQGILQAAANYFNSPVAIVGGAVLG
ncbi:MAG: hypothetical protein EBR82_35080 [Caulobacteraceae bacterium]|nr:hypothetical protein [Caulobacteraceae bacterium]